MPNGSLGKSGGGCTDSVGLANEVGPSGETSLFFRETPKLDLWSEIMFSERYLEALNLRKPDSGGGLDMVFEGFGGGDMGISRGSQPSSFWPCFLSLSWR